MASGDKHLSGEERALIETQARLAHPAQKPPRRRSQLPAHGRGPLENHERRRILPHPPRHPPSNPSPARRHLHPSPPSPRPGNPGNPHRPRPGPLLRWPLLPLVRRSPQNRVPQVSTQPSLRPGSVRTGPESTLRIIIVLSRTIKAIAPGASSQPAPWANVAPRGRKRAQIAPHTNCGNPFMLQQVAVPGAKRAQLGRPWGLS